MKKYIFFSRTAEVREIFPTYSEVKTFNIHHITQKWKNILGDIFIKTTMCFLFRWSLRQNAFCHKSDQSEVHNESETI